MKDKEVSSPSNGVDTSTAQDRGMADVWQKGAAPAQVDDDGALVCPTCASTAWTWHEVRVYTGDREDADGTAITAHRGKAVVGASPRAWFLGRRDDVRIGVTCECCAVWYDLQVVQHKGAVLLHLMPVKLETGRVYRGDPPGPR